MISFASIPFFKTHVKQILPLERPFSTALLVMLSVHGKPARRCKYSMLDTTGLSFSFIFIQPQREWQFDEAIHTNVPDTAFARHDELIGKKTIHPHCIIAGQVFLITMDEFSAPSISHQVSITFYIEETTPF